MNQLPPQPSAPPSSIMPLALAFEGGIVVLAFAVGWFMDPPLGQRVVWGWGDAGLGVLATLPMLLGLLAMRRIHRGPLGRMNYVVDHLLAPLFARCTLAELALVSLVAGVGEELLFRGVVQPLVSIWIGREAGLAIASITFGLLHFITPMYALLATVVGIYLGWLALATNNLLPPIVAHALYDFVALAYLTKSLRQETA